MSRLALSCPFCKRPMATSAAFTGQMIACPNCRGEFVLHAPASTPPPSAAPNSSPSSFRSEAPAPATSVAPLLAPAHSPPAASIPAPAAPPAPPPKTARFKVAPAQSSAVVPTADGKLPTLQLADADKVADKTGGGEKAVPLWLACLAVAASTVVSVFLLVGTPEEAQSIASQRAAARTELAQYYGADAGQLRPYQVLLREAQQAHSRGDRAQERQRYRDVLRLLRAEGRNKYEGFTGTPDSDEKLARLLATLLAED